MCKHISLYTKTCAPFSLRARWRSLTSTPLCVGLDLGILLWRGDLGLYLSFLIAEDQIWTQTMPRTCAHRLHPAGHRLCANTLGLCMSPWLSVDEACQKNKGICQCRPCCHCWSINQTQLMSCVVFIFITLLKYFKSPYYIGLWRASYYVWAAMK